ncbi:unnamed protein product, partial [Ectocarpus fasciculatus]
LRVRRPHGEDLGLPDQDLRADPRGAHQQRLRRALPQAPPHHRLRWRGWYNPPVALYYVPGGDDSELRHGEGVGLGCLPRQQQGGDRLRRGNRGSQARTRDAGGVPRRAHGQGGVGPQQRDPDDLPQGACRRRLRRERRGAARHRAQ